MQFRFSYFRGGFVQNLPSVKIGQSSLFYCLLGFLLVGQAAHASEYPPPCAKPGCTNHGPSKLLPIQRLILDQLARQEREDRPKVAFCFAPGTSQQTINAFYAKNANLLQSQPFQATGRWTTTATDGGGIVQGSPITLTWGIVADGAALDNGTTSDLKVFLNGIYGSQAVWQALMQQVFDRWSQVTGISYVFEPNDDGAAFPSSPGVLGVRADLRIGGHLIDGPSNVLAYNYFPNSGDMVIDTADTFYNNVSNNSLRFRNVFSHEHGHGMGLAHTCPIDQTKLMEPTASTQFDGPQHDDILSANRNYSDQLGANNTLASASDLGSFGDGTHSQTNLSLATSSDIDFYQFRTLAGSRRATITMSPVGLTYLEGIQNPDSSCSAGTSFNSRSRRNLAMELFDSNGTTSLGVASSAAAGVDEVLFNIDLGGGTGPFFLRVFGDGVDTSQLYNLEVLVEDGTPQPEIAVLGNGLSIADGDATPSVTDATDFGSVVLGLPMTNTFMITNSGTQPLVITGAISLTGAGAADFSVTAPVSPVATGASSTFDVVFTPSVSGLRSATVSIPNDDLNENPFDFAVAGTGVTVPEIDVQGNGISIADGDTIPDVADGTDFGTVDVLTGAASRTFVVTNLGLASLAVTVPVAIGGPSAADFSVSIQPATSLAPGAGTTFTVGFDPSTIGVKNATISIGNNDSDENPYDFAISGVAGAAPEVAVLGNGSPILAGSVTTSAGNGTSFSATDIVGGFTKQIFVITNVGSAALSVSPPTVTGTHFADFSISAQPAVSVAPGGFTTFEVRFDPSAVGLRTATVTFVNSDGDESPFAFAVDGTGVTVPDLGVFGNGIEILDGDSTPTFADGTDFGDAVQGGAGVMRTFTLTNAGSGPVTIALPVTIAGPAAGDFVVTSQPSAQLAAGAATVMEVFFTAGASGSRSATVLISSDDPDENPYDFAIQGQGTVAEIAVHGGGQLIPDGDLTPSVSDGTLFGTAGVSQTTIAKTFVITNSGDAVLQINLPLLITGLNPADFFVSQTPAATIAPGTASSFVVVFKPIGTGKRAATVEIGNNDLNEAPYDFAIEGTGTGPDIEVTGNGQIIPDNLLTTSAANFTDYGNVLVGGAKTNRFAITNAGSGLLALTLPVLIDGLDATNFTVVRQPGTNSLASGDSTVFDVAFAPTAGGSRLARVVIASLDSDENPYDFVVSGQGDGPEIAVYGNSLSITNLDSTPTVTDGTAFGGADLLSGFVVRQFTITNAGTRNLNLSLPVTITGDGAADFTILANPSAVISNGQASVFSVRFDPVLAGTRTATINLVSDDFDEGNFSFDVNGYGIVIPPTISIQPSSKNVSALADTSLFVAANGTEPLTYRWYRNGVLVEGAFEPTLALNDVTALEDGAYFVTISNTAGVVQSSTVQVTVNLLPTAVNWAAPAPVVYGTVLGPAILNATATAPGTITYSPASGSVPSAGVLSIDASFTPSNPNVYRSSTAQVSLTVNRAPLTITADDKQRLFQDTDPPFTFTFTGFVAGDSVASLDSAATATSTVVPNSPAGTYPIIPGGASSANYDISFVNGTFRVFNSAVAIVDQPVGVSVDAFETVTLTVFATGTEPLNYDWQKDGASLGAPNSPTLTLSGVTVPEAGQYRVVVSNADPSSATSAAVTVTVNKLTPVVTWVTPAPVRYGTALGVGQFSADADVGGTFVYNPAGNPVLASGSHTLGADFTPTDAINYNTVSASVNLTVTNAPLTIRAENKSREYLLPDPAFTVTYSGFVDDDTLADVITPPTIQTSATGPAIPGTYPITASGAVVPNYDVTYIDGVLTVFATAPTVTVDPVGAAVIVGDAAGFSVSASGTSPLSYQWRRDGINVPVGGLAFSGTDTFSIPSTVAGDAGAYQVVITNWGGSVTSAVANLIVRVPPTITQQPIGQTVQAGATVSLTVGVQGTIPLNYQWRKGGIDIAGQNNAVLTLSNVSSADAGNYSVQITNAAGQMISQDAVVDVNLQVSAVSWSSPASIVYGTALSAAQLNAVASVPGAIVYDPPVGSFLHAGNHLLKATFTPADTGRYESKTVNVSLTVSPAPLTITADNKTREITFANPPFTFSYSGFVNGDTDSQLSTGASASTSANTASPVGVYAIVPSGASSSDYAISYLNGTLTVIANPPVVTLQPLSSVVNAGGDASFTVAATGSPTLAYQWKRNGTDLPGANSPTLNLTGVQAVDDAFYTVVVSNPAGSVSSSSVRLDVVEPTILTWSDPSSISYGTGLSLAQLNATASAPGTFVYTPPLASVLEVGATTLNVSFTPDDPVSFQPSTKSVNLVVTPAPLTVTAKDLSREFGAANPPLTVLYGGFVNGDDSSDLTTQPSLSTTADPSSLPGTFPITISGAAAANYAISHVNGTLTVFANSPSIGTPPASLTVTNGDPISLSVTASGTSPLTYQWRKNGTDLPGETAATLVITTAQTSDAGSYDVVVSNVVGSATSPVAAVAVVVPPSIQTQPVGQTFDAFSDVTFSVAAAGTAPFGYQWFKNGQPIANATGPSLQLTSVTAEDIASYRVSITNVAGFVDSADVTLSVNKLSTPPTWPTPATIVYGTALGSAQLNAIPPAAGTLTYNPPAGTLLVSGTHTLTVNFVPDDMDNYLPSSTTVSIDVDKAPLSVVADNISREFSAPNPPLTISYSGFVGADDASVLTSAPTISTTADAASLPADYPITVSGAAATHYVVTHVGGTMTVFANPPSITLQPADVLTTNGVAALLSVGVAGTSPVSVQWRHEGTNLAGEVSANLNIAAVDAALHGGRYDVVLSNLAGVVTSAVANLTILVAPGIVQQPVDVSANALSDGGFSVVASGTAPLVYEWRKDGIILAGKTNAILDLQSVTTNQAGVYTVTVTNAAGSVTSSAASLVVNQLASPLAWTQPAAITYGAGLSVNELSASAGIAGTYAYTPPLGTVLDAGTRQLSVVFTPADPVNYLPGSASVSIQVQPAPLSVIADNKSREYGAANPAFSFSYSGFVNGDGPASLSSQASATTVADTASLLGDYPIVPTGASGANYAVSHVNGTLTVFGNRPKVTQHPLSVIGIAGSNVSFTNIAIGTAPLGYQWRQNGQSVPNATNAVLTITNVTLAHEGGYDVVVSNIAGSVSSFAAVLVVQLPPSLVVSPQSASVAAGESVVFTSAAVGTGPIAFQWKKGTVDLPGETNSTLIIPSVRTIDIGSYSVTVTNVAGSVSSAGADLDVTVQPKIVQQPANLSVNPGQTAALSVSAFGQAPLAYQWIRNGLPVADATNSVLLIGAVSGPDLGLYRVVVTNLFGAASSDAALLSISGPPQIVTQPTNQVVLPGADVAFDVVASGSQPLSYTWFHNGQIMAGFGGRTLELTNVSAAAAGSYQVFVGNGFGLAFSEFVTLTLIETPVITRQPEDVLASTGTVALLSVNADSAVPVAFQWRKDGLDIGGETNASLLLTNLATASSGGFDVILTNIAGSATSRVATVLVAIRPAFTTEPMSATQFMGSPLILTSAVSGTGPIFYQWRRNGVPIPNATNAVHTFPNLVRTDEASYSVFASNLVGTATSSNALVRVVAQATLSSDTSTKLSNGRFRLHFGDASGSGLTQSAASRFSVEASDNLINWSVISTNGSGLVITNGQFRFEDIGAITKKFRYYRVLEH